MQSKPGIISYGFALPFYRLSVKDVVDVWKNTDIKILEQTLNINKRTVLQPDEDTITLGADAARMALSQAGISKLDAFYLGTCTNPYDSRSSAAILLEMMGTGKNAFCADVQFSGKSGTSALQLCYAMVKAGLAGNALAVGSDTISRHTAPGDLTEAYSGAGAVAMMLGTENVIAHIDATCSTSEDLADNIRPQGERYIRSGMGLGSDKNNVGILRHMDLAFHLALNATGSSAEDFHHVVFQQPTVSIVRSMTRRLELKNEQTETSCYAQSTGDIGSASSLLGLSKVLDVAQPGERILVVSYGFGAGSDAIALTVTNNILNYPRQRRNVVSTLKTCASVDYATAAKYEFKFLRPDYALTPYL